MRRPWRRWLRPTRVPRGLAELPFASWIDIPQPGAPPPTHAVFLRGWVGVPPGAAVDGPCVVVGSERLTVGRERRREEQLGLPGFQVIGWRCYARMTPARLAAPWQLELTVDGTRHVAELPIHPDRAGYEAFLETKRARRARIEPHLRCPADHPTAHEPCGGSFDRTGASLVCRRCGATYAGGDSSLDFLPSEFGESPTVDTTDSVSAWGYDPIAARIIDEHRDGLVLDDGAGLKLESYDHVVNLDVADYPNVDVLAVGEHLPFADETFDAAFSLAVLEHVRDPFRCAAELARVVRPGGTIYAAVPFLQPYHGYPHHYFNMTLRGLESIFDEHFTIEESGTPPYGWPIWTLGWFLDRYLDGLPPETGLRFREMKVADLLSPVDRRLDDDFVLELDDDTRTELASMNYVVARRT